VHQELVGIPKSAAAPPQGNYPSLTDRVAIVAVEQDVTGVERSYLIVGATEAHLNSAKPDLCRELFEPPGLDHFPTAELFARNRLAWYDLLTGGTGRPTSIPELVSSRVVARESFRMDAKQAVLMCVAVEPVAEPGSVAFDSSWFCGDWPVGVAAPAPSMTWKARHWKLARALAQAGGLMAQADFKRSAEALGINYDKEFGLYYRGRGMFHEHQGLVELTEAGQRFIGEWEACFCD
jgi:hypothetical protein